MFTSYVSDVSAHPLVVHPLSNSFPLARGSSRELAEYVGLRNKFFGHFMSKVELQVHQNISVKKEIFDQKYLRLVICN